MISPRVRAVLTHPALWVSLIYLAGIALRIEYTFRVHPPDAYVFSDMGMYVSLARALVSAGAPLAPADVTHPLGYPALLAFLMNGDSLARVVILQIVVSCAVPLAVGLLGLVAFGRRTALAAVAFSSLYFPFIEYGALYLSEVHFILWLALAFGSFLGARKARRRSVSLGLMAAGGVALSIAMALKSVALPAALAFFAVEALALALAPGGPSWRARVAPWLVRGALAAVAAAPLLVVLARVCTRANRGHFCVTGNKMGADFLLGHYGRIADIRWADDAGRGFQFGSPSAFIRHYESHKSVPFPITDNAANAAEAWRWIFAHPFDAVVISLDHLYDTFFGYGIWPTFDNASWAYAHLSQFAFIIFLFVPTTLACAAVARRGARAFATSRAALVLSPIAALAVTVAIATGEVRYRIPFDIFFIVVSCAYFVNELLDADGSQGEARSATASAPTGSLAGRDEGLVTERSES